MNQTDARSDDLSGSLAIVTGAGRGLGRAQACALARAGCTVIVADIDGDAAARTAAELRDNNAATHPMELDVSNVATIEDRFREVAAAHGPLRVLVNNAAITRRAHAMDAPEAHFDTLVAVNLKGVYFAAQAGARLMRDHGGGSIINIASIGGQVVDGERSSIYDATKAGVIQLTRNMAYEWGKYDIRVNALAPGYVRTDMIAEFIEQPDAEQSLIDAHIPLGRVGEPADLGGPTVFLASSASAYITGHTLNVDGGWVIS